VSVDKIRTVRTLVAERSKRPIDPWPRRRGHRRASGATTINDTSNDNAAALINHKTIGLRSGTTCGT
jgi:hypothetical protein